MFALLQEPKLRGLQTGLNQRKMRCRSASAWAIIFALAICAFPSSAGDDSRPNILFITMDDLNDWIGCLGGHEQAVTPNIDRLAADGMLFTNAHCPAPACNPSRTAIFTGLAPSTSGLYENSQNMRELMPDAILLPQHFRNHGYRSSGSGKILHYFIDAQSWDEYYPEAKTENPLPRTFYPENRPVNLPRGGPWQYVETDWAALDITDEEFGGDYLVSEWVGEKLSERHQQPFFLACGIYRPHEPWFVPAKYFEPFPLEDIELPLGYKEGDLRDLPPTGKRQGPNRYFAHIRKHEQWKQAIQGYLASIHFADAMLGRILNALKAGPNRDNTIVVLCSDHGWHLGEKEHWQKFTLWRAATRVPLIISVPKNSSRALPGGTISGTVCDHSVNLIDLFPTLTSLAGVTPKHDNDGVSLVPLLHDPKKEWDRVSTTYLGKPGSYSLSADEWRYIHYANEDEELYHIANDPHEWSNLAAHPEHAPKLTEMRSLAPTKFAHKKEASLGSMPGLKWRPRKGGIIPASQPDGNSFDIIFFNQRETEVELFWSTSKGNSQPYGLIKPGEARRQQTRPGAVWFVTLPGKPESPLGFFQVEDRKARATIPSK